MALHFGLLRGTVPPSVTRMARSPGLHVSSELPECQSFILTSLETCGRYGSRDCLSFSCGVEFGYRVSRNEKKTTSSRFRRIAATSGQSFDGTEVVEKEATVNKTSSTGRDTTATLVSLENPENSAYGAPTGYTPETWDTTIPSSALTRGSLFRGIVSAIHPYGVFVRFGAYADGLVRISKLGSGYVRNVNDVVSVGQEVSVIVLNVEQSSGRIALSMVQGENNPTMANNIYSVEAGDRGRGSFRQHSGSGHIVTSTRKVDKNLVGNRLTSSPSRELAKKGPLVPVTAEGKWIWRRPSFITAS